MNVKISTFSHKTQQQEQEKFDPSDVHNFASTIASSHSMYCILIFLSWFSSTVSLSQWRWFKQTTDMEVFGPLALSGGADEGAHEVWTKEEFHRRDYPCDFLLEQQARAERMNCSKCSVQRTSSFATWKSIQGKSFTCLSSSACHLWFELISWITSIHNML